MNIIENIAEQDARIKELESAKALIAKVKGMCK